VTQHDTAQNLYLLGVYCTCERATLMPHGDVTRVSKDADASVTYITVKYNFYLPHCYSTAWDR